MLTLAVLIAHLRVDLVTLIFLRSLLSATNACLDIALFIDISSIRTHLIDKHTKLSI